MLLNRGEVLVTIIERADVGCDDGTVLDPLGSNPDGEVSHRLASGGAYLARVLMAYVVVETVTRKTNELLVELSGGEKLDKFYILMHNMSMHPGCLIL